MGKKVIVRLVVLGDKCSGKSSLISRCIEKNFDANERQLSSGLDYSTCWCTSTLYSTVELKIFELPVQSFPIAKEFDEQADALLLMLDATQPESSLAFLLDRVGQLMFGTTQVSQQCIMLAYNKFDRVGDKSDDEGEAEDELQELPLPDKMRLKLNESAPTLIVPLRPVSALTGSGVDDLFQAIVHAVLLQRQARQEVAAAENEAADTEGDRVEATRPDIKRRRTSVVLRAWASKLGRSFRRKLSATSGQG